MRRRKKKAWLGNRIHHTFVCIFHYLQTLLDLHPGKSESEYLLKDYIFLFSPPSFFKVRGAVTILQQFIARKLCVISFCPTRGKERQEKAPDVCISFHSNLRALREDSTIPSPICISTAQGL